MKTIAVLLLACILVFLPGCSSHRSADRPSHNSKRIVDIVMRENSESLILAINGNQSLSYTASMQETPLGILIQFPDTGLELSRNRFHPPDNEFISVIRTGEIEENNTTTSNILIGLKKKVQFNLVPGETGVQIVLPKSPALSAGTELQKESANTDPQPLPVQKNTPAATVLKSVTSKSLTDRLVVDVEADGAIENYKTFTLKYPARIVFDIYQVKSSYRSEKRIAVESKFVKQIRYFGHPDKLRLVLETDEGFLANYTSFPTQTGLFIQVGGVSASASQPQNSLE